MSWTVHDQARINAGIRSSFRWQRRAARARREQEIKRGKPGTCMRLLPDENGWRECGKPAAFWYVNASRQEMFFCEWCASHIPEKFHLQPIKDY